MIKQIALVGTILAMGSIVGLTVHNSALKERAAKLQAGVDDQAACVASIKLAPKADRPSSRCDLVVALAVVRAQQSIDCDSALAGDDAYRVAAACSASVKVVVADRDSARIERDGLTADLKRLRDDQVAALARAARRATTQAHKETIAHAALDNAPVDGAGLTVCAADCLRGLAGEVPAADGRRPTR